MREPKGAKDTLLRRQHQGPRRPYERTFIDSCAKIAFAKLYDRKTPTIAAELLNDRVVLL
jgi:hypothetical protein